MKKTVDSACENQISLVVAKLLFSEAAAGGNEAGETHGPTVGGPVEEKFFPVKVLLCFPIS